MKLTLRTLLAWLDDTLPPEEAREIGRHVADTPFAQQLVDRIRRVTRQRRLTVPPSTGDEASDPNVVAAYLDNELSPERVAEFETRCLSSDVHLAEAASSHQILSLIKNKAKVPPEARYRMYRLIKGREAVRTTYTGPGAGPSSTPAAALAPMATPGELRPPWAEEETPTGSVGERIGPPLLAVLLIGVLAVVGWMNLRYAGSSGRDAEVLVAETPGPEPLVADQGRPQLPAPPASNPGDPPPIGDVDAAEAAEPIDPEAEAEAEAVPETETGAEPIDAAADVVDDLPSGVAGVVEETDGVLLRAADRARSWERIGADATIAPGDRVLNLAPFRTTIRIGPVRVELVAQSEVRFAARDPGEAARFDLLDGSVVLRTTSADRPLRIGFAGRTVTLEPPIGIPVGVTRLGVRAPGTPSGAPLLTVVLPEETLSAAIDGDDRHEIKGPALARFDPIRGYLGDDPAMPPRWVTDPEPSPADARGGEAFAALFEGSGGPILFTLLEGVEDPDPSVRALSVAALGATSSIEPGNLELVFPLLNRPGVPEVRGAALGVIYQRVARGEAEAKEVRDLLGRFVDPTAAAIAVERLIIGVPPEEIEDEVFEELVGELASPNVSVRQLALQALQALTGRDTLGYDPDAPDEAGLNAWRDLLKQGKLNTPSRPEAGATPSPAGR